MDFFLLLLLVTVLKGTTSMIEITQHPQNLTVEEGESASFTCSYTGTTEFPTWYIAGASYTIQGSEEGLPPRHMYVNQMMMVSDVQVSDNETTYRCSFLFGEISSRTAVLTVIPAPQGDSENWTELSDTTYHLDKTTAIVTTQPVISTDPATIIISSTFVPNTLPINKNNLMTLSIGIAVGIIIVFTSIIVTILLTWLFLRKGCSICSGRCSVYTVKREKEDAEEPTYAYVSDVLPSVKTEFRVEANVCYANGPGAKQEPEYAEIENVVVIKTQQNEAYENARRMRVVPVVGTDQDGVSPNSSPMLDQDKQRNSRLLDE